MKDKSLKKKKISKKKNVKDQLIGIIQEKAPEEPDLTCPDINSLQDLLEKLRTTNTELRSAAEYWRKITLVLCEHVPAGEIKSIMKNITENPNSEWDFINDYMSSIGRR